MKKLGQKLVLSYAVLVLFSILILSVPILRNQSRVLKQNIVESAEQYMVSASECRLTSSKCNR
ncbi:MAG: hypothetical protein IJ828_01695 [Treponema sp.]|nr:hypothetical protein [Treponema sp.]